MQPHACWASSQRCCSRSCTWKHSPTLLHRPDWIDVLTLLVWSIYRISLSLKLLYFELKVCHWWPLLITSPSQCHVNYHIHCPGKVRSSKPWKVWRVRWRRDCPMPSILANARLQTWTSPKNHLVLWLCLLLLLDESSDESEPESEGSSPVARGPLRDWIDHRSPSWAGLLKFQKNSQIWSSNATETRCQHLGRRFFAIIGSQF